MLSIHEHTPRESAPGQLVRNDTEPPHPAPTDEVEPRTAPDVESIDWEGLVEKVRCGDPAGMEQLYSLFGRGVRFYLYRQLGPQELDDKVHDTFLIVVQAIRRGDLREPERLMGFVKTVLRRQVAAHINEAVQSRREQTDLDNAYRVADHGSSPEEIAMLRERRELMAETLASIPDRDREILIRFYLYEQPQSQICDEMRLSETQFRLLKSRAKARFGEIGKRRLSASPLSFFLRKVRGA